METTSHTLPDSSIDQGPFVNIGGDGLVAAVASDSTSHDLEVNAHDLQNQDLDMTRGENPSETNPVIAPVSLEPSIQHESTVSKLPPNTPSGMVKCLNILSRHSNRSVWLLAYIAITTSWPVLGSIIKMFYRRKLKNAL